MRKLLLVLFALTRCVDAQPGTHDAGPDAFTGGSPDGGKSDAGTANDAGFTDGGDADAGATDAKTTDGGTSDGGVAATVLRVHYPAGAKTISVRGSGAGLSWSQGTPLTPGADDVWTISFDKLAAPIEWKPILDNQTWSRGPNYHLAPGQSLEVYPHFNTTSGTVTKLFTNFVSAYLANNRDVWVYLPPTYLENTRARLPVLYMHDGQNLFDSSLAFGGNEWKVDEAFNAAAESGTCDSDATKSCQNDGDCPGSACHTFAPAIVIGVGNTQARIDEYTPTSDPSYGGGMGNDYLKMLVTELKPAVDLALRTQTDREHTLMMGSSLGGLISSYAGIHEPAVWGRIGAMSPSTWWDGTYIIGAVLDSKDAPERAARVYVDCGDSGTANDDVANTTVLAQAYRNIGYADGTELKFIVAPGHQHSETYWAQRFPGAMRFLLGPRP
ncbi:MAG: alpha/beta hydrolase [Myxococcales bacterium]|nr:alpha/beta hydrolase [Myxococcales bacterium]